MPPITRSRCSKPDGVKGSAERRNKGVDKQRPPRHTVRKTNRPESEQSGPDPPVSPAASTVDATDSFKPPYILLDYVTKRVAEKDVKSSRDLIVSEACLAELAKIVKLTKTRPAPLKRDGIRRQQGRSAMTTREESQKGEDLWAGDQNSSGISLDADRENPGDSVPANVARTEGEENQDSASSSRQEQFDTSSDDLTELGSDVSEEDGLEEDGLEEDGLEEDGLEEGGLEEDGSKEDGSESFNMVDSVDSSLSEV